MMRCFPPAARAALLPALALAVTVSVPAEEVRTFSGATPLEWSQRMAQSEMERRGDTLFHGGAPRARWDYTSSLFGLALLKLADATDRPAYADYGARTAESFITPEGEIRTYQQADYNIDMIAPGKVLLHRYEQGHRDESLRTALETLREQMRTHPRTSEGGYWHKLRYPHQMWLDGLFMAGPFLAHYAKTFEEPALFDDVANQILLMDRHAYDEEAGLHYHAWDEKRAQSWADPQTGQSPNFWSRAIGWYGMALVDSLDFFSPTHPEVDEINAVLRRVAAGIVRWQDPASGLWWQVTDQGPREGNYLEATASSMFVYTLAKGINRGYLPREQYLPAAVKAYEGIIRDFIREGPQGRINLTRCCEVAGLGYTSSSGRARDGSFEYYISEPIVENDLKGVGPFILAGIELQQLLSGHEAPLVVRGWDDYEAVLSRIRPPEFPDRDFPITDFGAKPGVGATEAIRAAIQACHDAGGGRVVIPAGDWLTGAIHLKSNVNLHVSEGATLRFSTDPQHYPIVFTRWEGVELMGLSPLIYAFEQENIAITGRGTLDGQGAPDNWWSWKGRSRDGWREGRPSQLRGSRDELFRMGEEGVPVEKRVFGADSGLRPQFIQPYRSRNVLIEGVTVRNSPMWHLNPVLCQNVTVRDVKVIGHGPNNDGLNPESSRDVLIENCLFDTGDDCIAIKSGRNNDGRRVGVPAENIIVRNCVMKDGHGGVVLGSECSGGIRNVFVEDCQMDSPDLDRALRFKNNAVRGGVLENVFMRRVRIGRVGEAVLTIDLLYEEGAAGAHTPVVRNVQMDSITSTASPRVMFIRGFEGAVIEGIRISNSTFRNLSATEVVEHAGSILLDRVTLTPEKAARPANSVPAPAN